MTEMAERVGRAIAEEGAKLDATEPYHIRVGRAALKAMREPTDIMVRAGNEATPVGDLQVSDMIYEAMIDAALE
jgi:hypothetical protein